MFQDISSQVTLPVLISLTAFLISNVSAVIAYRSAKRERQRSIRTQITDVLGRIVANQLAHANLRFDTQVELQQQQHGQGGGQAQLQKLQYLGSVYGQQSAFLLDQVKYLTDQVPELVTTVEYNTLAAVNADAGNWMEAEHYYVKAIQIARNTVQTALATNSYARFLFNSERPEEGRRKVAEAIAMMKGDNDVAQSTRGQCYQQWALCEMLTGAPPQRVEELFGYAAAEFSAMHNKPYAQTLLDILAQARNPQPQGPNALTYMSRAASKADMRSPSFTAPEKDE
jgi:hypothetical protein